MSAETITRPAPEGEPRPKLSLTKRRRRRPVRWFFIVSHRWLSLVLGLVLLAITISGSILLYRPEIHRALNAPAYAASGLPPTVSITQARDIVLEAHPDYEGNSVWMDSGVWKVTDYETAWTVDPGTGKILGHIDPNPSWLVFLDNLHECFLACEGDPGYVAVLNKEVPGTGWLGFEDANITWAGLALGTLGLLLLYLSLTGLWLWFPRPSKWRESMNVRWRRGRRTRTATFARDTDLHKVAGMIVLAFLLMWGLTGAGFELGFVEKAWYAATPGEEHAEVDTTSAESKQPDISIERAVAAAQALHPHDTLVNVDVPAKDDKTSSYTLYFAHGYDAWQYTEFPGDLGVYVDRHTGVAKDYYGFTNNSVAEEIWDNFNYTVHTGFIVNGWWRVIWLVMGLSPVLLAWTGLSTWLIRTGSQRRRKKAKRAAAKTRSVPAG